MFRSLLAVLLVFSIANGYGQTKKTPRPVLTTLIGQYKDSVRLNAEEAERVISQPLRIVDDKKTVYTIASYQFLYRRNVVTEDEQTGKITPTTSIASQRFTSTPLPDYWIKPIMGQLKAGEEIWYFDIIVKDPNGKVSFAPDVKIKII